MRKIALGRLHIPAKDFYLMTLAELYDAIEGHSQHEKEKREWYFFGVRRQIYFTLAVAGNKDIREQDIIPLDMDEDIRELDKNNLSTFKLDGLIE